MGDHTEHKGLVLGATDALHVSLKEGNDYISVLESVSTRKGGQYVFIQRIKLFFIHQ